MRSARKVVVWALIASLWGVPGGAAAIQKVIGKVVVSSSALLDGVAIPDGSTITAGDVLNVTQGGSALVEFRANLQASLSEGTSVSFGGVPGHLSAQISSGTIVAKKLGDSVLVIETPRYKIAPSGKGTTVYAVGVLSDESTAVIARRGEVSITETRSGQSYLLHEGHSTVLAASLSGLPGQEKEESKPAPAKPAGQAPAPASPPEPPKGSHKALGAILGAGAAAGVIAAIAVSSGGKGSVVSPSQP